MKGTRKKKSAAREWIESLFIAFVLAMFLRTFVIQAFKIPTSSMYPTLKAGDRILVNKVVYGAKFPFTRSLRVPGLREPQVGEIIVFEYPENPSRDFIKRLIAKGGQRVRIAEGRVWVDGKPAFNGRRYYNRGLYGAEGIEVEVPKRHYYVLGDNSASSRDSRYWGFVSKDAIVGKAFLIYWPFHRIGPVR